jgi:hypothetical protein
LLRERSLLSYINISPYIKLSQLLISSIRAHPCSPRPLANNPWLTPNLFNLFFRFSKSPSQSDLLVNTWYTYIDQKQKPPLVIPILIFHGKGRWKQQEMKHYRTIPGNRGKNEPHDSQVHLRPG